ncbi:MAG: GNAT family N-acetyltransferase [Oscillospiraceae bacterium]|nr:GNAT family N-acetyltransferase [Oscillospiraceae bacterium]
MIQMQEIMNPDEKSEICNTILRALPSWFGVEASIVDYTNQVKNMPFYTALSDGSPVGFVALKTHSSVSSEIYVMGILHAYHRQGIGKRLIAVCEQYCKENNIEFLTVKTLDESRESKSYQKTRLFYLDAGFKPLEVFPLYWDADNPCLFMVKPIAPG